jgi:ribosomal protein S10
METWQFSLFFGALLVGYVLVHVRVARFEQHLQHLARLQRLEEQLARLQQMVGGDAEPLRRIEAQLQRLGEGLEDLREATVHVSEAVVQIPQPSPTQPSGDGTLVSAASVGSPKEQVRAVVESRLLHLGYGNLRLLTDLAGVDLDGDIEVQVECERGQMPAKGRVLVRNGAVRDVSIQTVAATFP